MKAVRFCRFCQVRSFQGMYWQDLMSSGWDFFLYSLLFSIGSFLHYGHLIVEKSRYGNWKAVDIHSGFAGAVWDIERWGIRNSFPLYLKYIFVPGMLMLQIMFL